MRPEKERGEHEWIRWYCKMPIVKVVVNLKWVIISTEIVVF